MQQMIIFVYDFACKNCFAFSNRMANAVAWQPECTESQPKNQS